MKVNTTANGIATAFAIAKSMVEKRSSLLVHTSVRLRAKEGEDVLELFVTDGERSLIYRLLAGVEQGGELSVNVLPVAHVSSALMESVSLIGTEKGLEVVSASGRSRYLFPAFSGEEVEIPTVDGEEVEIPAENLIGGLKRVSHAIAKERGERAVFCGVCFRVRRGKLYLIASDRRHLAEVCVLEECNKEIDFVIPAKTVQVLTSFALKGDAPVLLRAGKTSVEFRYEDRWSLVSRVIEEQFQDHFSMLPDEYELKVKVEKRAFLNSLKRVIATTTEFISPVTISVIPEENMIHMDIKGDGIESHDELEVIEIEGAERGKTSCFPKYLLSSINMVEGDHISLLFPTATDPSILVIGEEGNRALISTVSI